MSSKHLIVVSAENNLYMAWQCMLFHFSCQSRLGQVPVIIVHETNSEELHEGFLKIVRAGGRILRARSFKLGARGDTYLPRNTPGTLLRAALEFGQHYEFLVLCDPDMIFASAPEFPETLSGDYCSYVNFDRDFVEDARRALNLPRVCIEEQKESLRCGVPYVIPCAEAGPLAETWLEAIDAFPARRWEDVMYAFGLAVVARELKVTLTHMAQSNYWPDALLYAPVVHYCYGDEVWSKRQYFRTEVAPEVWRPGVEAPAGTVLAEILAQIREAGRFYAQ